MDPPCLGDRTYAVLVQTFQENVLKLMAIQDGRLLVYQLMTM